MMLFAYEEKRKKEFCKILRKNINLLQPKQFMTNSNLQV